ncbi:MAG: response regulator [Bdellovibrionales bacterium]
MRVLIVDDEEAICMFVEYAINDAGYETLTASNGKAALELVKSNPDIEIVISDVKMSGMSGVELYENIKKIRTNVKKFILITGFSDLDLTEDNLKGITALISKPIDMNLLLSHISDKK